MTTNKCFSISAPDRRLFAEFFRERDLFRITVLMEDDAAVFGTMNITAEEGNKLGEFLLSFNEKEGDI